MLPMPAFSQSPRGSREDGQSSITCITCCRSGNCNFVECKHRLIGPWCLDVWFGSHGGILGKHLNIPPSDSIEQVNPVGIVSLGHLLNRHCRPTGSGAWFLITLLADQHSGVFPRAWTASEIIPQRIRSHSCVLFTVQGRMPVECTYDAAR